MRPDAAQARADVSGCDERGGEISLLVDGELGDAERRSLDQHLDACPPCRSAAHHAQAFRDAVRRAAPLAAITAPAGLRARLRVAIAAEAPPVVVRPRFSFASLFRPLPVATVGATALGLSAWLYFGTPADDIIRDIVARHSRRLPLEFESSDPASLENWLSDKVDFRVRVPRIHGKPLNLLGARLSNVRNHAAVYVLYGTPESPQRRVSLVVYDNERDAMPPVTGEVRRVDDHDVVLANSAGYNVAMWKQNEIVYSLVSDGEEDVLDMIRESP